MFTQLLDQNDLNKVEQLLDALNNKLPPSATAAITPLSTALEVTIEITDKQTHTKEFYTIFKTSEGVTFLRTFIAR